MKPYRLRDAPAVNVNEGKKITSPPKAHVFRHSVTEGEELYDAAREGHAPDREVGNGAPKEAGQNRGEDHIQVPDHPPAIPWPPAPGVTRMPMKLK